MQKNWKFHHVSVMVKDMDKAIKFYETLGVGPFPPTIGPKGVPLIAQSLRGQKSNFVMDLRYAEGGFGGLKFELVEPLEGASIYKEFLEKKGEGIHHIAFTVDDLDAETAKMTKRGFKVIQTGQTSRGKFAYFDTDKVGGIVTELVQFASQ
jgi:catechol 2,3-dioxygenase-like lactoylglutathione lyase family enzyme